MKRDDVFPSKYLKAADLNGRPVTVTIKSAPYETLKNPEGKEQGKTVLYFVRGKKALPLNIVNWDSVARFAATTPTPGRATRSNSTPRSHRWAPCQPRAKRPATANGLKDATTDPDRIRVWWHHEPAFNVAVATGAVSGIFVVDVDGLDAEAELRDSKRNMARFPPQSRPLPHAAGTSISR